MIKTFKYLPVLVISIFVLLAFSKPIEKVKIKCMVQITNYTGEGAYIVISLLNPEGNYEQTLYVHGKDNEWYSDIYEWWKFYGKRRPDIDAISGETIAGGERAITILNIDADKIDKGYSIRFETAVEDQEYYKDDIQFELTTENLKSKLDGKGFIRYVRMMAQ